MSSFVFDREKYLQLFKTRGATEALTLLQKDLIEWEYEAYEGEAGYQPEMWQKLEKVREFSRELWDMAVEGKPLGAQGRN